MKLKDFDFRIWSNTGSEYLVTPDKTFHDYQCNKNEIKICYTNINSKVFYRIT